MAGVNGSGTRFISTQMPSSILWPLKLVTVVHYLAESLYNNPVLQLLSAIAMSTTQHTRVCVATPASNAQAMPLHLDSVQHFQLNNYYEDDLSSEDADLDLFEIDDVDVDTCNYPSSSLSSVPSLVPDDRDLDSRSGSGLGSDSESELDLDVDDSWFLQSPSPISPLLSAHTHYCTANNCTACSTPKRKISYSINQLEKPQQRAVSVAEDNYNIWLSMNY